MKKLAVLFPGVGYTCGKPLLYYTGALAAEKGYETVALDYGQDVHSFRGRTAKELEPVIELALERCLPKLLQIPWKEYGSVLFISKSIGTVVACRAAGKLPCHPRHFLMTPIEATLSWLDRAEGMFVAGSADPYLDQGLLFRAVEMFPEKVGRLFPGCNHSLERKNDTLGNIHNLTQVLECLETMLIEEE